MAGFLLALGLLFNPFISVHLNRQIWAVIDVATGLFLFSISNKLSSLNKTE